MDWRAVVDRIEGEIAVLLCGEEEYQVDMPLALLPQKVKEGDHLNVNLHVDLKSTNEARQRVTLLLERLKNKAKGP